MQQVPLKFLFEGVIFTSYLHVIKDTPNGKEIIVTLSTKYLIKKFQTTYRFVILNGRFKPVYPPHEKEEELVGALQTSLLTFFKISEVQPDEVKV